MIGQRAGALAALALAGLAGCRPGALGRCNQDQDCRAGAFCSTDRICLPRFAVTVFVPAAPDAVNGWVPRIAGDLEVRAAVEDGTGQPVQGATLAFDTCPAAAACSYPGTVLSRAGDTTEFSFQVPRFAQVAGSEAPLAVTVTATGAAGKQAHGTGALQIDDAPPQIGNFTEVTAATRGEDGKDWFAGGSGAPPVEIAVPVTDAGAGVASLALVLVSADVVNGTTLKIIGTPSSDGTVHFQLPADAVQGREGSLRFTLTATDALNNSVSVGPDTPKTMIFVDALPPVVPFAPRVDYTTAAGPAGTPQCAADTTTPVIYHCGRQAGTYMLADDSVTVSFDAYDCGGGMPPLLQPASISTKATTVTAAVNSNKPNSATQCTNGSGNKTHHYSFTLNLATAGLTLDPPIDNNGTMLVKLAANANDRLQQVTQKGPGASQTSGDGLALVSVWRWKSQVTAGAQPSGAPALIPGTSGSRQIAVGTTLPSTGANLFVLNADGSPAWVAQVSPGIGSDLATGQAGLVYAISPAGSCGISCTGSLNIVAAPPTGMVATAHKCDASNVSFGTPPVILATTPERAVAVSTAHATGTFNNVFFFTDGNPCSAGTGTAVGTGDYAGVSASPPTLFFANGNGFTSEDLSGATSFDSNTQRTFNNGLTSVPTAAPPSIAAEASTAAIFGSLASDQSVRRTLKLTCGALAPCWNTDPQFTVTKAGASLPFTPVFDANDIYVADAAGTLYAISRASGGTPRWTVDFTKVPSGATGAAISPPVLLGDGSVLEVRSDGVVALASSGSAVRLLGPGGAGSFKPLANPVAPVLEMRGAGGVAYVSDGDGFVWAVQLAVPPATAGASVWPRPGRDSCNSRNAGSTCQ